MRHKAYCKYMENMLHSQQSGIASGQGEKVRRHAVEGEEYDMLLVIGGCTNCCASFDHFNSLAGVEKVWSTEHIPELLEEIEIARNRICNPE